MGKGARRHWLAIDADGCIGIFDADVYGSVPPRATRWTIAADARRDWGLQLARVERALEHDADALIGSSSTRFVLGTERAIVVGAPEPASSSAYRASPRLGESERLIGEVRVVRDAAPRIVATTRPLTSELAELLERDGDISRWLLEDDLFEVLASAAQTGVFRWRCPGPSEPDVYERVASPTRSIRTGDLEPEARARVERARMPETFSGSARLKLPPPARKKPYVQ